ncbi:MAG: glycine cleavage system aminomethyltransferase GcvT [Ignavibacteriaceae bacterium]|nr:glycine cleavage system aminomethyltransferase GcvT [Ignavibacteriaceae bacterium]
MKKTTFFNIHEKLGAKLVEFAGYYMPIQYSSIIAEHKAVRNAVGVFDVSHMGEVFVTGEKALDFVQYITINDASKLFPGRVQYSAMLYNDGGIVDDLLVYKLSDEKYLLVINASNIEKDFKWMQENNKFGVELSNQSDEYSLLAVQGPFAKEVVQAVCGEEINLERYHFMEGNVAGVDMIISHTGYTGEIGYELYFKGSVEEAEMVWDKVFEAGEKFGIQPAGLGCRDSLRLEMGYCLYGNDIDQTTNPLEANLGWITKINKGDFIGRDALLKVKQDGLKRKLVAITADEKVFPRHGYDLTVEGKKIGTVTSGTVSPILEKPIALGYVDFEYAKQGSDVNFFIRGKEFPAKVVTLPFVKK